jgi:hypothetical protein
MRHRAGDLGGVLLGIMAAVGLFVWCMLVICWRVIRKGWRFAWDLEALEWVALLGILFGCLLICYAVWI